MYTFTAEQQEIYTERSHLDFRSKNGSHSKKVHSTKHRDHSVAALVGKKTIQELHGLVQDIFVSVLENGTYSRSAHEVANHNLT